jgi:Ca2+-binding EF-hand superfamily protein
MKSVVPLLFSSPNNSPSLTHCLSLCLLSQQDSLKFKLSSNILRMIRVLVQKGLNLEEYFRVSNYLTLPHLTSPPGGGGERSAGGAGDGGSGGSESGMMDKEIFLTILRKLDLPFTSKDLMIFCHRYSISSLQIDYELFINDIQRGLDGDDSLGGNSSSGGHQTSGGPTPRFHLVHDLKLMLLESKDILNKSYDDIYRMFSRWDNYGTGMVTITQFFRVLSQLHIHFNDQDQDFLVDLLDSDGQGKVDFEGLLAYCFSSEIEFNRIPSHVMANPNTATLTNTSDQTTDECLSMSGSTGNGTASTSRNMKRPHTASAFRGHTSYTSADATGYHTESRSYSDDLNDSSPHHGGAMTYDIQVPNSTNSPANRRPLTASARVLNGEYKARPKNNNSGMEQPTSGIRNLHRPQSARPIPHDESHFILEINSDNEDDDAFPPPSHRSASSYDPIIMPDIKGQGAPHQLPQSQSLLLISPVSHEKSHKTSSTLTNTTLGQSSLEISAAGSILSSPGGLTYPMPYPHIASLPPTSSAPPPPSQYQNPLLQPSSQRPLSATTPHLITAKSNLRSVLSIYLRKTGLSIHELFNLFDNKNVRFFGAVELTEACRQYFNLNLSPTVASALISSMAVDGYERVSYSDLLVFITDPIYQELEEKLQKQIGEQLEQHGREYQYLLFSVLSQDIHPHGAPSSSSSASLPPGATTNGNGGGSGGGTNTSGIVSSESFQHSLTKLGFTLSADEIDRIVTKYDTHGTKKCSVSRFMSMLQNNPHWKFALETISCHEEAIEECQIVRQRTNSHSRHVVSYNYPPEMIDMCEYLGIRILSEPELLWIVEEAVNAPLPEGWTIHHNQEGKTYFYHKKQNVTRWDHPLDPYFRKLRDENRKRSTSIHHSLSLSLSLFLTSP